jgi:hypothetical protein
MEVHMNLRRYASLGVPVYGLAILLLTSVPFVGQSQSTAKKAPTKPWTPPKTPDGKPDLQGVWNSATLTPLERSKQFGNKATLTEEEAAAFERNELKNVDADRRDGGGAADVGRAYNEFWRDRGKITPDRRTSLIVDPPDGRVPPLTAQGKKLAQERRDQNKGHQFDGPENRGLPERCIWVRNAGPPMIPTNYNSNYQITQSPGYVAILSEQIHDMRVIPTDGRPHLAAHIRQYAGDGRGRWEGNTLVVETTNFTPLTAFQDSGEHMRLIEKFTRTDANTLMYEFTVDDPESFTAPWTAKVPMMKTSDMIYEYACHEGNYGLEGSLAGARAEERKAEEAKRAKGK